jgi:hypothetical protein
MESTAFLFKCDIIEYELVIVGLLIPKVDGIKFAVVS